MDAPAAPQPSQNSDSTRRIFVDKDGVSLPIFVESTRVYNRFKLVRTLLNYGGKIMTTPADATIVLVNDNSGAGRSMVRSWRPEGKTILQSGWVDKCVEQGVVALEDHGWAGCTAIDDGGPSEDDDDDGEEEGKVVVRKARTAKAGSSHATLSSTREGGHSHSTEGKAGSSKPPLASASLPRSTMVGAPSSQSATPQEALVTSMAPTGLATGERLLMLPNGATPPVGAQNSLPYMSDQQATFPFHSNSPAPFSNLLPNATIGAYPVEFQGMPFSQEQLQCVMWWFQQFGGQSMPINNMSMPMNPVPMNPTPVNAIAANPLSGPGPQGWGATVPVPTLNPHMQPAQPSREVHSPKLPRSAHMRKRDAAEIRTQGSQSSDSDISDSARKKKVKKPGFQRSKAAPSWKKPTEPKASSSKEKWVRKRSYSSSSASSSSSRSTRSSDLIFAPGGTPLKFYVQVPMAKRKDVLEIIKKNGGKPQSELNTADYCVISTAVNDSTALRENARSCDVPVIKSLYIFECSESGRLLDDEDYLLSDRVRTKHRGRPPGSGKRRRSQSGSARKRPKHESRDDNSDDDGDSAIVIDDSDDGLLLSSRSSGRSPSPPPPPNSRRRLHTNGRYLYTDDERHWVIRYTKHVFRYSPDTKWIDLSRKIHEKQPHRTANAWHTYLERDDIRPELQRMKDSAYALRVNTQPRSGSRYSALAEADFEVIVHFFASGRGDDSDERKVWQKLEEMGPCQSTPRWRDFYLDHKAAIQDALSSRND